MAKQDLSKEAHHHSLIFEKGLDLKKRIIYINEEITEDTQFLIDAYLTELESLNDQPITIKLSTLGGDTLATLGIVNRIERSPCHTTVIASGYCMSAGLSILAAADHRQADKDTIFMHHQCQYSMPYAAHGMQKNELEFTERMETLRFKALARQTGTPATKWKKLATVKDYYFTSEKAVELGLIHELL